MLDGIHRFEHIFLDLQMHRLFRIFKFVKARKEQDLSRGPLCLDVFAQLQAIHIGHLDIRHNDIRLEFLHHLKSLHPIIGISDYGKAEPFPIYLLYDYLDDFFLVIHQKHRICVHLFLRMRVCVTPFIIPNRHITVNSGGLLTPGYAKRARTMSGSCGNVIRLFFLDIFETVKCYCHQNDDTGKYKLKVRINSKDCQRIGKGGEYAYADYHA